MKSPVRVFFCLGLLFIGCGILFSFIESKIDFYHIKNLPAVHELDLARFYWLTGQTNTAIVEYEKVIENAPATVVIIARAELGKSLFYQKTITGQLVNYIDYVLWAYPPKLYIVGGALLVLWLVTLLTNYIRNIGNRNRIAILPIQDFFGLGINDEFPNLVADRLRELAWRIKHVSADNEFVLESLEMPVVGMAIEAGVFDTVSLIETALTFTGSFGNLSLSRFLNSLYLWLEQPKYILRCRVMRHEDKVDLHVLIIEQLKGVATDSWDITVDERKKDLMSYIIDAVIFPLLFRYSKNIESRNWESLRALHYGLLEFQLYQETDHDDAHLNAARNYLEHALKIDPSYMIAKYNLGLLLLRAGEYEVARDLFKNVISTTDDKHLRKLAMYNYGVSFLNFGQDWAYRQALDIFQEVLDEAPNDCISNLAESALAMACSKLAMRAEQQKEEYINLAIKAAQKVLRAHRGSELSKANAFAAMGFANLALDKSAQAVNYFAQALEKFPDNASFLLGIGETYLRMGDREKAVIAFSKVEVYAPANKYASYRLGNLYREVKEIDKAVEAYKKSADLAVSRVALGKISLESQDFKTALREFRLATDKNSRLSEAWVNIAWTIVEMDDKSDDGLEEAENSARRALQLDQGRPLEWHRRAVLARVLLARGKYQTAYKEALRAIELAPERAQAYYYLALAEYYLGWYSKAQASIQKVLCLDKYEWHLAAEQLLNQINTSSEKE